MTDADDGVRARREELYASRRRDRPPPTVDAAWLARQLSRHDYLAADVAAILGVTPTAAGQWLSGTPIPAKRQRQLMDLFGEPLSLRDATTDELLRELVRRGTDQS